MIVALELEDTLSRYPRDKASQVKELVRLSKRLAENNEDSLAAADFLTLFQTLQQFSKSGHINPCLLSVASRLAAQGMH